MEGGVEAAAFAESFGSTENPHTCNYTTHQSRLGAPVHILPPHTEDADGEIFSAPSVRTDLQ